MKTPCMMLALAVLAGCSGGGGNDVDPRISDASRPLVFLANPTEPPCTYRNEAGEIVGTDVDLARKIAAKMGRESLRDGPMAVYHLQNPAPASALEVSRAVTPDLQVLSNEAFEHLLAHAPVDADGDLLAPLLNLWNQQKGAPSTILVDCAHTTVQLERAGFRTAIPGPERLLRAFRFSPDERIKKEDLR